MRRGNPRAGGPRPDPDDRPGRGPQGSVRVQGTKSRRKRERITGTPKSKTSKRTVPLPPWLATRLAAYLADTHRTPTRLMPRYGCAAGLVTTS